jgi:hypothetical protein
MVTTIRRDSHQIQLVVVLKKHRIERLAGQVLVHIFWFTHDVLALVLKDINSDIH